MSAPHAITLLGSRATVDAALGRIDTSRAHAQGVLDGLVGLARQDGALAMRLAMVLAWVKRHDVSLLGYPSFTAFCRERVGWADSWVRDLVRLVESPLELVKAAACRDLVPLRVAVKAPGHVAPDRQAEWLLDPVIEARPPRPLERFESDDAVVVQRARRLARLCLGRAASAREVDDYILRCWRERVPAAAILADARERPAKPEWEPLSWGWCEGSAPAEALVGPWKQPETLEEAVRAIDAIQALRRGRVATLARVWASADFHALWLLAGADSPWEFAREVLGWSRRTAQRHKRLGWTLEWYPELDRAVASGLDVGSVALLSGVVGPSTVERWIAVAWRIGKLELALAARDARYDSGTLERYERALTAADAWVGSGDEASAGAPLAGGPGGASEGRVRVALPHEGAERDDEVRGPRELPEASRWFLEHVRIEPQHGFARVKERDGYRCQNPECGRESLRNEAHHLWPRSLGGPDVESNGITVCRPCHLRGIHTGEGRIAVDQVEVGGVEALLWRYAGGRSVLAFRGSRIRSRSGAAASG